MIGINENTSLKFIGNGTLNTFGVTFPRFELQEIEAYIDDLAGNGELTQLTYGVDFNITDIAPPYQTAQLTLVNGAQPWLDGGGNLDTGYNLYIVYNSESFQDVKLRGSGRLAPALIEKALDRFAMVMKSINRVFSRSIRLPERDYDAGVNPVIPSVTGNAKKMIVVNNAEDGWDYGPTTDSIFAAEVAAANSAAQSANSAANSAASAAASAGYASNSQTSATSSASSATNSANSAANSASSATNSANSAVAAATSEANAATSEANSAASAAASASSAVDSEASYQKDKFGTTVSVDWTASPITLTAADNDKLYLVDTNLGEVVFNLPAIAGLPVGFHVGVVKETDSAYDVKINPNGVETINTLPQVINDVEGIGFNFSVNSAFDWFGDLFAAGAATAGVNNINSRIDILMHEISVMQTQLTAVTNMSTSLAFSSNIVRRSGEQRLENNVANIDAVSLPALDGKGDPCRLLPTEGTSAYITFECFRKNDTDIRFGRHYVELHRVDGTWYVEESEFINIIGDPVGILFDITTDGDGAAIINYTTDDMGGVFDAASYIRWSLDYIPNSYIVGPPAVTPPPLTFPELELWFDMGDPMVNVAQANKFYIFYDKSYRQRHAVQSTAALRADKVPAFLGGLPVARFTGAQYYRLADAINTIMRGNDYSIIALARHDDGNAPSEQAIIMTSDILNPATDGITGLMFDGTEVHSLREDVQQSSGALTGVGTAAFRIIAHTANNTTSKFYVDGVEKSSLPVGPSGKISNQVSLGSFAGVGGFLDGYVAEIMIFSKELSPAEISTISMYIQSKWGAAC